MCSESVLKAILSLFSSEVCLAGSGGALVSLWPAVDAVYRQRSWVASDSPGDAQWTCLGLAAAELIGDYLAVSGFVGSRLGRSEILNCWIAKCVLATMRSLRGSCWFCPCLGRWLWQNWTALATIAWPGSEDCELRLGWDGEMTSVADWICFLTSLSGLLRAPWQQHWEWRSGRGTGSQLQKPEGEGEGKIKKAHVYKTDTKKMQENEQGENRERKTVCLQEIKTEKERGRKRFCGGTEILEGGQCQPWSQTARVCQSQTSEHSPQTTNSRHQTLWFTT